MSRRDDIKRLIINHRRRLQKLAEKQALKGIDAEAELLLEIDDLKVEIERLQMELTESETVVESTAAQPRITLASRTREEVESAPNGPNIIKPNNIDLNSAEKKLLRSMYSSFSEIGIAAKFDSGFSGSSVFRVLLEEYLPEAAKIAPLDLIEKERQAYETLVKNKLYSAARILPNPDLRSVGQDSGLRYELVGGGIFEAQSLAEYYRQAGTGELFKVLKRLFRELGEVWWGDSQRKRTFQMKRDYDALLPVNLLIKPIDPPPEDVSAIPGLNRDNLSKFTRGDSVKLENFVISKVNRSKRQVTLTISPQKRGLPHESYRLRLVDVANIETYQRNQEPGPIYGEVMATRRDLLAKLVKQVLDENLDLSAERLDLPGDLRLRNPLLVFERYLEEMQEVRLSTIHGDLNLENILVDRETGDVRLIDFATVRQGHVLHDFLRLETQILTKHIPEALNATDPKTIHRFFLNLHKATFGDGTHTNANLFKPGMEKSFDILVFIRQEAKEYLSKKNDWPEYYRGLVLYLLSALKFKELDKMAKQVALWGSATVIEPKNGAPPVIVSYNVRKIRMLLDASFDDTGLESFCSDYYLEVFNQFSRGMRKGEKVLLLLDYCRRTLALDKLLERVSAVNPHQYQRFELYIEEE